jgi:hypothetical protein
VNYFAQLKTLPLAFDFRNVIKRKMKAKENKNQSGDTKELPGYPLYPASEDIYERGKEEIDLDPEKPGQKKDVDEENGKLNELTFDDEAMGGDLDVPGSELDDKQENIGSEDEENNLYSLGGDKD